MGELMKARGWKHCPGTFSFFGVEDGMCAEDFGGVGCQTPVEKITGCNHMTVRFSAI